jgi:hypothetical protein
VEGACLRVWPQLPIGTVIKHVRKKGVVQVTGHLAHGTLGQALVPLQRAGRKDAQYQDGLTRMASHQAIA